jgi:hypothetical protein
VLRRRICCGPLTNLTENFFISLYFLKSARGLAADAWNGQCVGQNTEVEARGSTWLRLACCAGTSGSTIQRVNIWCSGAEQHRQSTRTLREERFQTWQRVRESNPCTSLESAYAFPRVRFAIARLLQESGMSHEGRPRLTGSR